MNTGIAFLFCLLSSISQAQSFFERDTVEFVRVTTDVGKPVGCHLVDVFLDTILDGTTFVKPAKKMSCEVYTREKLVFKNSLNEIYWHENPDKLLEHNTTVIGQSHLNQSWKEPSKPHPKFKAILKKNSVYYIKYKSKYKYIQWSLHEGSKVKVFDISDLKSDKPELNNSSYYSIYETDTTINIDGFNVECYVFHRENFFDPYINIFEKMYVEKTSLIPILNFIQEFRVSPIKTNKDRLSIEKNIMRTHLIAPVGFIKKE